MSNDDILEFGKRVAKVRQELKIKQEDFAPSLNIVVSTLSLIETGKTKPGYSFFKKITDVYNVNPLYLLTGKGEKFINEDTLNPREKRDYGEFTEMIEELYYYLDNSPMVKFAVMDFFKNYLYNHQEVLAEDIKKYFELKKKMKK